MDPVSLFLLILNISHSPVVNYVDVGGYLDWSCVVYTSRDKRVVWHELVHWARWCVYRSMDYVMYQDVEEGIAEAVAWSIDPWEGRPRYYLRHSIPIWMWMVSTCGYVFDYELNVTYLDCIGDVLRMKPWDVWYRSKSFKCVEWMPVVYRDGDGVIIITFRRVDCSVVGS
jgi:cytochrome c oxidase subunit IV